MPTVPRYDNLQTQVNPGPSARFQSPGGPQAGAIAAEQGSNLGRAVSGAGDAAARIALDAMEQANQVRLSDAMNKATAARLKLTYDPAEGFTNLRGEAALTRPDGKSLESEYTSKLQTTLDEITQGLGNDRQRNLFKAQSGQLLNQFQAGLMQHVGKEYVDHSVSVQAGTTKLAQEQMGLAWGDAAAVNQSRAAIKAATAEEGRLRGWSAVQVEAATVGQLSRGHSAVVLGALQAGKTDYAAEYLKQIKGELTDEARLQLTGQVESVDVLVRGDMAAEGVWGAMAPKSPNEAVKLYDMEAEIRSKHQGEPKLRDAALASLKQRAAAFNAQQAEVNAQGINAVFGLIDGGMPMSQVKRSPAWLSLPEVKRHEISKSIEAEAASRASRMASDASRSLSNMQRQDRLMLINNGGDYLRDSDPDRLANMTRPQVEAMRTKYGFEGTQQLLSRWDTVQNKDSKLTAKIDNDAFKSVVQDTLNINAYDNSLSPDTKAMLGNLKVKVDTMLGQKAQQLRRPLTPEEKADLMRTEAAKTVTVGGWWNSTQPVATLSPDDAAKVVIEPKLRATIVEKMGAQYKATGDPQYAPTESNLRRLYLRSISPISGLPNADQ